MTKKKTLTKKELSKLKLVLDNLESEMMWMYKHISGGFAEAKMFDYDNEIIDVEFKYGIQDGCSNETFSDNISIDRKTMVIID